MGGGTIVEVGGQAQETSKSTAGSAMPSLSPTRRDFDALVSWLGTFPFLQGKRHDFSDLGGILHDETFAA